MASTNEKRQDWMQSVSSIVNPDDYLLGRKIDKTFELAKEEKTKAERELKIDLIAKGKLKLKADPILELGRKKEQLKYDIITNPRLLKQFRDFLTRHEAKTVNVSKQDDQFDVHKESSRQDSSYSRDHHPSRISDKGHKDVDLSNSNRNRDDKNHHGRTRHDDTSRTSRHNDNRHHDRYRSSRRHRDHRHHDEYRSSRRDYDRRSRERDRESSSRHNQSKEQRRHELCTQSDKHRDSYRGEKSSS